jgi:hypothetical protein
LTNKLAEETKIAAATPLGRACIKNLQTNITKILNPEATNNEEQRVRLAEQEQQQRVIDDSPIITLPRIMDAPPIMQSRNPTAKCHLKNTPQMHRRQTRNNTPGAVPIIKRIAPVIQHVVYSHDPTDTILTASMTRPPKVNFTCNANHRLI